MTSLLSHKCERCECGVDSRHPARSDGRAQASLAARRSTPPGTIRIGTSTATKMFRIQLTKINQSESHPATPAGRGTHHAPSLVRYSCGDQPPRRHDWTHTAWVEVGLGRGGGAIQWRAQSPQRPRCHPSQTPQIPRWRQPKSKYVKDACGAKPSAPAALPETLTARTDTPPLHSAPAARVSFRSSWRLTWRLLPRVLEALGEHLDLALRLE